MKTTGRSPTGIAPRRSYRSSRSAGSRISRQSISRSIAPVDPEPAKRTTWSAAVAPTAFAMVRRASSRNLVVCRPVPDDSVWVLPYKGRTASRMKSSMKASERPEAV